MPPQGFVVLPRRWVVERTLSWIDQQRRMSKDYERLCASGEAFVYAAMIRLMTRQAACPCLRAFHTASEGEFCEVRAAATALLEQGFAPCVIILAHLEGHEGRSPL
jgi:Transposase DDE domain